jgi:hypothetical protein
MYMLARMALCKTCDMVKRTTKSNAMILVLGNTMPDELMGGMNLPAKDTCHDEPASFVMCFSRNRYIIPIQRHHDLSIVEVEVT